MNSLEEFENIIYWATKALVKTRITSRYPTEEMRKVALEHPRIGLGIMGLHNWLIQRGYNYEWNSELEQWFKVLKDATKAYGDYWCSQFGIPELEGSVSIAPTGSISRLCNGISSGIEPIFAKAYVWKATLEGKVRENVVIDNNILEYRKQGIDVSIIEDAYGIASSEDGFKRRVEMQAMVQQYVDNAISSTINLPMWGTKYNNVETLDKYRSILLAYLPYLRGITVYADGSRSGQPLTAISVEEALSRLYDSGSEYAQCANGVCGN